MFLIGAAWAAHGLCRAQSLCPQKGGRQTAGPLPDSLRGEGWWGKPRWDPAGQPEATAATQACTAQETTDPHPHCEPSCHAHSPRTNDPAPHIQGHSRSSHSNPLHWQTAHPVSLFGSKLRSWGDRHVTGSGLSVALPAPGIEGQRAHVWPWKRNAKWCRTPHYQACSHNSQLCCI